MCWGVWAAMWSLKRGKSRAINSEKSWGKTNVLLTSTTVKSIKLSKKNINPEKKKTDKIL